MGNLNVVVVAPNDYSKALGKKGTASDITLYDIKKGHDTVSLIEPTKYPERLAPLFYACSMADFALVVVEEVNAQLGEGILMMHCLGIEKGWFVLGNYLTPERILPLIKDTALSGFSFIENDPIKIREMLLDQAAKAEIKEGAFPERWSLATWLGARCAAMMSSMFSQGRNRPRYVPSRSTTMTMTCPTWEIGSDWH
jgi:hypothetical protein